MDLNLIALGATYIEALCLNSIQGMYVARRQQNGPLDRLRRQLPGTASSHTLVLRMSAAARRQACLNLAR